MGGCRKDDGISFSINDVTLVCLIDNTFWDEESPRVTCLLTFVPNYPVIPNWGFCFDRKGGSGQPDFENRVNEYRLHERRCIMTRQQSLPRRNHVSRITTRADAGIRIMPDITYAFWRRGIQSSAGCALTVLSDDAFPGVYHQQKGSIE